MGTPEVSGPLVALGGGHVWLAGSRQGEGPQGRSTRAVRAVRVPSTSSEGKEGKEQMGKRRSKAENDKRASGCVRRSWEESKMEKEL